MATSHTDAELGPGNLFATGLVAGGAVADCPAMTQPVRERRRVELCTARFALASKSRPGFDAGQNRADARARYARRGSEGERAFLQQVVG